MTHDEWMKLSRDVAARHSTNVPTVLHNPQAEAASLMLAALKKAWVTVDLYEAAFDVGKAIAAAEAAGIKV